LIAQGLLSAHSAPAPIVHPTLTAVCYENAPLALGRWRANPFDTMSRR
jgi:hypothetical protein